MSNVKAAAAALAILAQAVLSHPGFAQKHYVDLEYPPLRDIEIPEVEQVTLQNGMKLFLLEDHELPLIRMSARIRTGSIYEPADKVGLAGIAGEVMRTGGTKSQTGDEIDETLENIAASVETGIGESSGYASMSVLKQDIDTGLTILADVLMNPEFREDKIELAKVQRRTSIARRNDDVSEIAFREFVKLIYGADSPYARHAEYATIANITRDDLIAFHQRFFHPNNLLLGVWGDFETDAMVKKLEQTFKDWPKTQVTIPPKPQVDYEYRQTVHLIEKKDVNQTNIIMGHIGGRRDDPDYFALILMNRILGQGFTSRLFRNVRSRAGLAYSVFGVYSANYDYPGVLYVGCQTKSETTVQAIRALRAEVRGMTEAEVTDEELAIARESYLNSFVFNFDSEGEIINRLMTYEYYGYPHDFLMTARERIEDVTKADILRVAKEHLHPDEMQILAVGRPEDFDEPLSGLGEVNEIDITIPVPEEAAPDVTAESLSQGRTLLQQAIAAAGGKAAFAAIESVRWKGKVTAVTPQGEMGLTAEITMAYPDRVRAEMRTPMGNMTQILNADEAWVTSARGTMPAPQQMKQQMQANLWRNIAYLFAHSDSAGVTVQYLGSEDVEGTRCEVIQVTPQGVKPTKLYLDAKTLRPTMMRYQGTNMAGAPVSSEERFSDFREVSGVMLPFGSVTYQDGRKAQESRASEIKINVDVDGSQFEVDE